MGETEEIRLWPGISAGLPVLVFGLAFIMINLLGIRPMEGQPGLLFAADGIVLVGLVLGWRSWFPSWSYAFAGMALLFSLWWSTATEGMAGLFYGLFAWTPVLIAIALALVLTRTLRPLLKFVQGILRDWSLASLGFYSVLPMAMYAAMSFMPANNAVIYQAIAVLLMVVGAGLAGLAPRAGLRGRALLLGMSWSWVVVTIGVAIYWHGKVWDVSGETVTWFQQVLGMSLIWLILAMVIFFPAVFALLGRLGRRITRDGTAPPIEKT